ncbi:hypothetical protein AAG570_000731 [Ranatra chinensis]|uniref:Uncharacterized protein n=1 Tax=Ranatra chinensis TaxID=642074 RepID=A0ABD0ZET0_9HEMI
MVQGLRSAGLSLPGSNQEQPPVLALVSFNSQECHTVLIAAIFLSATVVPIDPSLEPEDMKNLLEIIGPTFVYTETGKTLRKVETALALLGSNPTIIVSGRQKHPYVSYQSLLLPTDPEFRPKPKREGKDASTPLILFTSGISGPPKAVQITDEYLIYNCCVNCDTSCAGSVILATSPIFWISGIVTFFASIVQGKKRVFLRGPARESVIFETIQNYKVSVWFTSPNSLLSSMARIQTGMYNLSSLKMVVSGGSPLSPEVQLRAQRELFRNRLHIFQVYGLTELGILASSFPGSNKLGSVGKARDGILCKVVNLANGESVQPYVEGELCFKGHFFMKGYLNGCCTNTEYDKGDWFHTGDIGYVDDDGYIFVIDRLEDLITYNFIQITPSELEGVLLNHPAVKDVAVFGVPNHHTEDDWAIACVVTKFPVTENQLVDYVAERVPDDKHLRGGIKFVEFIPRTSTGKVRRNLLRSQLRIELQI